jgi:hypothetical protein
MLVLLYLSVMRFDVSRRLLHLLREHSRDHYNEFQSVRVITLVLCKYYSRGSRNAQVRVTPTPQHNAFRSIAAVTPQQNVIKLRKSRFILYNSLRRLCASLNLFLGGGLPAFWWFLVELVVQPPGHPQKLYHPQHLSDAL